MPPAPLARSGARCFSEEAFMKILFEGDSITDAGRDRSDPHNMGSGYPKYAAELIRARAQVRAEVNEQSGEPEFWNFSISGSRP